MPDHSYFENLIWQIADLLRGPYRPPQYERVMLPLTVLRRFDSVLAPTMLAEAQNYLRDHHADARLYVSGQDYSRRAFATAASDILMKNVDQNGGSDIVRDGDIFLDDEYFDSEVKPYVPDAWMDRGKDRVGYEINFNRYFYVYTPPRALTEIDADLERAEDEVLRLLREVTT